MRQKRKVEYPSPAVTGQPYLTLEKITPGKLGEESITLAGNAQHTYEIKYKVGFSNIDASDLEMTQGAKDLGFNLDLEGGWLTATLTPVSYTHLLQGKLGMIWSGKLKNRQDKAS